MIRTGTKAITTPASENILRNEWKIKKESYIKRQEKYVELEAFTNRLEWEAKEMRAMLAERKKEVIQMIKIFKQRTIDRLKKRIQRQEEILATINSKEK